SGAGQPVIWLPGFTNPGSIWNETQSQLEGEFENHFISYAGFNGHEPIGFPWYDQVKQGLLEYVVTSDLKEIIIIGHSMGGNLAVELAAEFPDRVSKTILIDALPCMREIMMPGVPVSQLQYESPYNTNMLNMDDAQFAQMLGNMAMYMTTQSDKVDILKQWMLEADRKTYVYGYTDLLKLDLRETLSNIKSPTLIVGASFPDKNVVSKNFSDQYAKLSNKQIEIADDSKHFVMFDQPEWLTTKINDFLKE
ncbi:alpha/beta hydrolase, partial [Fulvivirga sp. RKSG066]|uniref:alpha/beta fold hydrolase n=1 Tax=Fulvivirga aurantia TaxID=2529383 RepID=UPI0012BD648B